MSVVEKVFPTEEELSVVSSHVQCSAKDCSAVFKSTSNLNMHLIRHHKVSGEELCRKESERQFYCPAKLCIYSRDSTKFFKKLKYLKQHFLKVHATKNFVCNKCEKRFATEAFKNMHVKTCGNSFYCTCGSVYNSAEALLTHCRRKGSGHINASHTTVKKDKLNFKKEIIMNTENNNIHTKQNRFICPKLAADVSYPIHYIAAIALSELSTPCNISKVVDKSIQTEFPKPSNKDLKRNSRLKNERKQNNSQQTQTTGRSKKLKISTETQTNADYLKQKMKTPPKLSTAKKRRKSMETQTKELLNITMVHNESLENESKLFNDASLEIDKKPVEFFSNETSVDEIFNDISSNYLKDDSLSGEKRSDPTSSSSLNISDKVLLNGDRSFSKRTRMDLSPNGSDKHELFNPNAELIMCDKEFDADLNDLSISCKKVTSDTESLYLMESSSVFDINKLCNIETQTEMDNYLIDCNEDAAFTLCSTTETQTTDFDSLLYSNMCTQTCDEMDQLFNFNFVDIETQTAWPDL